MATKSNYNLKKGNWKNVKVTNDIIARYDELAKEDEDGKTSHELMRDTLYFATQPLPMKEEE
ncbi:MAG: hypothetical protein ACYTBJ_06140 [Planctomycetota bacterium]|jgi:hypothetical protein